MRFHRSAKSTDFILSATSENYQRTRQFVHRGDDLLQFHLRIEVRSGNRLTDFGNCFYLRNGAPVFSPQR